MDADYDPLAWVYDRYWAGPFHTLVLAALERMLLTHMPAPATVVDIGCGCGHLAGMLGDRGYAVVGVDVSYGMLGQARRNAPRAHLIAGDARALPLTGRFDAVLFTFDGLNHLAASDDLEPAFRCARRVLATDRPFFFDLLLEEAYETTWTGERAIVAPDHVCIVRGGYDAETRLAHTDITLFTGAVEPWHRRDVCIQQRCHPIAAVLEAARAAGFRRVEQRHAERDLGLSGYLARGRLFCVAR